MKIIFKTLPALLILSFFLSACNSSLSITKRRYTRGFYVHRAGHTENQPQHKSYKYSIAGNETRKTGKVDLLAQASLPAENVVNAPHKTSQRTVSVQLQPYQLKNLPINVVTSPVKTFKALKASIASADTGDDALSLLWILVVVLLIVYILGLLLDNFGIGWLVHLLLVAALIVLILWLLKAI